jgi:hypothetical protein
MPYYLDKAKLEEAADIAWITVHAMDHPSQRLKYGNQTLEQVVETFANFNRLDLEGATETAPFFVARDEELGGKIISYAQWAFPKSPDEAAKLKNPTADLPSNRISLPEEWNMEYVREFGKHIFAMRERTINGRPAYSEYTNLHLQFSKPCGSKSSAN